MVDAALIKLKALGFTTGSCMISKLFFFGISCRGTGERGTRLSDEGIDRIARYSFGAVEGNKKLRNDSDHFDEPILRREADLELQRPEEHFEYRTTL